MKESLYDSLDKEGRMLLRFEEKVADAVWDGDEYNGRERYDSATLQKTSGSSYLDDEHGEKGQEEQAGERKGQKARDHGLGKREL
jgi:hypothetical protein